MFASRWSSSASVHEAIAQFAITYLPAMNMVFDTHNRYRVWVRIFAVATTNHVIGGRRHAAAEALAQPPCPRQSTIVHCGRSGQLLGQTSQLRCVLVRFS